MYNDVYSKISTPMQFAEGLAFKHYNERQEQRKFKRKLISDNEKIAYIKQECDRRRIERLYFELKWQLNMAFIEGVTNVNIDSPLHL